ncbi:MAG TPA: ABC transporter ATP-binding protein [Clostridia bacterium]|nr:ABC transporter ATP-binding protein [Clostridia bacterium]
MIGVNDLVKSFGDKMALRGISFNVEDGEIFGFLGPNGAGKTTTLRILTGQLKADSGKARIMELDATGGTREIHSRIGVVPEETNLYERLTIGQNLDLFCRLYGCDIKQTDYYLERIGMAGEKNTQVKKLSKGMKQKVLLVRALLHSPKILFLDEPTSGLDPASADTIHKVLKELNDQGITVLLTSHNMEEVDKLCNRVAFLNHGEIVEMGRPETLKMDHSNRRMKVLIDDEHGLISKELDMDRAESAKLLSGWMTEGKVRSVHSCEPTLAEIFVKVTGREFV